MFDRLKPWFVLIAFAASLIFHFIWVTLFTLFTKRRHHYGFHIRRSFCRSALKAFGIKLSVKGEIPADPKGLFISNHRSLLDPLIELSFLDVYILSKSELGHCWEKVQKKPEYFLSIAQMTTAGKLHCSQLKNY